MLDLWMYKIMLFIKSYKWFILAMFPFVCRLVVIRMYWPIMKTQLTNEERESDAHRGMLLTLAGFSFSAFFILIVTASTLDKSKIDLELPVVFMLISFILFYAAFLIEAYKFNRFRDEIGIALNDTARLSLLISIAIVVSEASFSNNTEVLVFVTTFGLWAIDYFIKSKKGVTYKMGSSLTIKQSC